MRNIFHINKLAKWNCRKWFQTLRQRAANDNITCSLKCHFLSGLHWIVLLVFISRCWNQWWVPINTNKMLGRITFWNETQHTQREYFFIHIIILVRWQNVNYTYLKSSGACTKKNLMYISSFVKTPQTKRNFGKQKIMINNWEMYFRRRYGRMAERMWAYRSDMGIAVEPEKCTW